MRKEIPFLSAREINEISDYERFRNVKAYINQKSDPKIRFHRFERDREILSDLAHKTGYKKVQKFDIHRQEWHSLQRKIPRSYLEAIGVEMKVLRFAEEIDQEEYREALKIPRYPRYASIRYHPAFYGTMELPPGINEDNAIEIVREYAIENERICFINYPQLKNYNIYRDGEVGEVFFKPELKMTKDFVIPSGTGYKIGRVTLK